VHPVLFEIFGRQIGTYGLFMILGAVSAWFLIRFLAGKEDKDMPLVFLISIAGGIVGTFMLRPITRIPEIIMNWEYFRQMPIEVFFSRIFGEIVFYGALIGGVIAMVLFCRGFKMPILPYADLFAPGLALAHGFGRVGCFFGGCCFGIPISPISAFAVVFPAHSAGAPPGIPLLAIQLIEAGSLFIITAILVLVYKKTAGSGLTVCLYGALYSVLRFILEFFRGDLVRGVYGGLSTSQYISIAVFIVSAAVFCYIIVKKRRDSACT